MLRVTKESRAEIAVIAAAFVELERCCAEDTRYCTTRTKPAKRTHSGLSEVAEVPDAPGKRVIVNLPFPEPAIARKAHALNHNRRSQSLSGYQSSITSSSRQGSRSSFVSAGPTRPMSHLSSQTYIYTDHDSPVSETGSTPEYNALAFMSPAAFETMYRTRSAEQRAAFVPRDTIVASSLRYEASSSVSDRSPRDMGFSSNGGANESIPLRVLKEYNISDVPERLESPALSGNGAKIQQDAPKKHANETEAVVLEELTTESRARKDPEVERHSKWAWKWKSTIGKLRCW